jgi:hypothetical protein
MRTLEVEIGAPVRGHLRRKLFQTATTATKCICQHLAALYDMISSLHPISFVHAFSGCVCSRYSLYEKPACRGQSSQCEEPQDGGVQRTIRLDDAKDGVLVDILKNRADLQVTSPSLLFPNKLADGRETQ